MLMKQEVHGQWFEHRLQVAGTHGLLDLSDELPEKDGSKVHLEINEWNCEFELFILESLRLVEEQSQREVVQVQEWVMLPEIRQEVPPTSLSFQPVAKI